MGEVAFYKENNILLSKKLKKPQNGWFEESIHAIIELVKLTDEKYNLPNFNYFSVCVRDIEDLKHAYSLCSSNNKSCFPDFNFYSWSLVGVDSYTDTCEDIKTNIIVDRPWKEYYHSKLEMYQLKEI